MSITAFPVLCRILTELKLLETTVGVVVLSAGVGNDVVGWILLALTVALVNSAAGGEGTGVTAVYILLCAVGWTLLLVYPIRWAMRWLAIRTGSIEKSKPSPFMMTTTLFLVFASAFVTDIIGVHPIFGGFLAAFAVPREIALDIVIKTEDLVTTLFLPIYFTRASPSSPAL
jgi:Kef-type K+ transport system membrane component KefB